ncbi:hypothetical protein QNH39_04070 [Neobacillus novalis]|uniref:Lipoprotein n=1 Tax=Neobacillus novalis TaxID=220687 RepID=A0AA95MPH4_9BACI|nr:hypothetical protein [Neobacillus novalis]WHY87047.1 hypothetical protein QNH39_04070 [Neobacillus novalis]
MKQKYLFGVFAIIMLFILIVGCSKDEPEKSITMNGEIVLHSVDKNENYLTISTTVKNNQHKNIEPFYVEYKINDKWLSSIFEDSKIIVGKKIGGGDGQLFTIKPKSSYQIGENYKIVSPVDEKKLKQAIEKENAVEVILLNQDKKVIMTGYINKYLKQK